jgi:hypothetical protein
VIYYKLRIHLVYLNAKPYLCKRLVLGLLPHKSSVKHINSVGPKTSEQSERAFFLLLKIRGPRRLGGSDRRERAYPEGAAPNIARSTERTT